MKANIRDGVIQSPYPPLTIPQCSIYRAIKDIVELSPQHRALEDEDVSLTRSEFLVLVQRFGAGFQLYGIKPGDHVCVHLNNSVDNFVALLGCLVAGATLVLAKPSLTERELRYEMSDSDTTYLLTEAAFAGKTSALASQLNLKGMFVMGEAPGFVSVTGFRDINEEAFREVPVDEPEKALAVLIYTSGSTGLPKSVEFTHRSIVSCIQITRECLAREEADVRLSWCPITHTSGLVLTLSGALYAENCIITSPNLTLSEFINVVEKFKITSFMFFPMQLRNIVDKVRETEAKLPNVRRIGVWGGVLTEPLAQDTLSAFDNLEEFSNIYAMSEACGMITNPPSWTINYGDVGFPCSSVEIKIVDATTRKGVRPLQLGEICFRTPAAARGYYKRKEATREFKDQDGWCHSGDVGYYDNDGRIHYVDRIKDMMKCMDNQVAPGELEELLLHEFKAIDEVAVVGIPHPNYGEAPAAVITLKVTQKGQEIVTEEEIRRFISKNCATHKHLHGGVFFVDKLQKTENGKLQRRNVLKKLMTSTRN